MTVSDKRKEQNRLHQKTFIAARKAEGKKPYRFWLTDATKKAVDERLSELEETINNKE